jgi:hypothetical protein
VLSLPVIYLIWMSVLLYRLGRYMRVLKDLMDRIKLDLGISDGN